MRGQESEGEVEFFRHRLIKPMTVEDRLYQRRILETCTRGNTLVILPTAMGKTIVALLLAVERLESYPDCKVVFLAPTRPLTLQHRDTFSKNMTINDDELVVLTGWVSPPDRELLWKRGRLVFATPQTLRNDVIAQRYGLHDVSLIIFDEAHRARGAYAYSTIAESYVRQCSDPLILALTASPGAKKRAIEEVCKNLLIESVEYRTDKDPDVRQYINPLRIGWHRVELPLAYKRISSKLNEIFLEEMSALRSMGILTHKVPRRVSKRDLLELGESLRARIEKRGKEEGYLFNAVSRQASALSIAHAKELLESQGVDVLKAFIERMMTEPERSEAKYVRRIVNSPLFRETVKLVDENEGLEHPKLRKLREIIAGQIKAREISRVIVFTQYRDTASAIVSALGDLDCVRAVRFVGQQSKLRDLGMTQEEQAKVLGDFRSGAYNVLVATSIAEEGLDIPSVELVVFYEPIPSEIRYIQRKGRTARRTTGRVEILIAKGSIDEAYYWASRRREAKMREIIAEINRELGSTARRTPIHRPTTIEKRETEDMFKREAREIGEAKPRGLMPLEFFAEGVTREGARGLYVAAKWLVKALRDLDEGDGVTITKLLSYAKGDGINPRRAEAALVKLLWEGVIWYPKPNRVKLL